MVVGFRMVWEGVRAERKRRLKKAREKAVRITMRGVRIAATSPVSVYVCGSRWRAVCAVKVIRV